MLDSKTASANASWRITSPALAKLELQGNLNIHTLQDFWRTIRNTQDEWLKLSAPSLNLEIDATQVTYLDGAGVAFLIDLQHAQRNAKRDVQIIGLAERFLPLLKQFEPIDQFFQAEPEPISDGFMVSLGKATAGILQDAKLLITFIGRLLSDLFWAFTHPTKVRWHDFVAAAVQAGIAALPIIALVSFLIGVILAFQSAVGMRQFGAQSFVAPLVSLGIFRELGPLITAILLAGRSSAAFAAEIGTMTVNSEVDALVTAGLNPMRFLVVPRVLAGILVAPILTIFANLISVFAVCITMTMYKIPLITSYNGLLNTVHLNDIFSGLLKSILFGIVVSGVGCMRGMQTGTGAAAVGISTTRAVVSSIVMIVVVDGIFAFISTKTGF
jgi:phospholipid/cholesterol/gamma-HCH transport system permease protein